MKGDCLFRGDHALSCLTASEISAETSGVTSARSFENFLKRPARHHRHRRRFGITLVVWNEDAREECFQDGAAVA